MEKELIIQLLKEVFGRIELLKMVERQEMRVLVLSYCALRLELVGCSPSNSIQVGVCEGPVVKRVLKLNLTRDLGVERWQ